MQGKRRSGFSLLELLIVVVVMSILILIGTINWRASIRMQEFNTQFDRFVQQLKEAQTMARAYGLAPEGYESGGDATFDQQGEYRITVYTNGMNSAPRSQNYKDLIFNFDNFEIKPMDEDKLREQFKGAAIVFYFKGEDGYTATKMLPLNPNGTPACPIDQGAPTDAYYELEVTQKDRDGALMQSRKIRMDSNTGALEIIKVK